MGRSCCTTSTWGGGPCTPFCGRLTHPRCHSVCCSPDRWPLPTRGHTVRPRRACGWGEGWLGWGWLGWSRGSSLGSSSDSVSTKGAASSSACNSSSSGSSCCGSCCGCGCAACSESRLRLFFFTNSTPYSERSRALALLHPGSGTHACLEEPMRIDLIDGAVVNAVREIHVVLELQLGANTSARAHLRARYVKARGPWGALETLIRGGHLTRWSSAF